MKKCPYCANEIREDAIKCMSCLKTLAARKNVTNVSSVNSENTLSDNKGNFLWGVAALILIIVVVASCYNATMLGKQKIKNGQTEQPGQTVDVALEQMVKVDGKHSENAFRSLLNAIHSYYPEVPSYRIAGFLFHAFIEMYQKTPNASLYDFVLEVKNTARDPGAAGEDDLIKTIAVVMDSKIRGD